MVLTSATDPLAQRLQPYREEFAAVIAGGAGDLISDWAIDKGITESLEDAVRLYAPNPFLRLRPCDSLDWPATMGEVLCHPDWPYSYISTDSEDDTKARILHHLRGSLTGYYPFVAQAVSRHIKRRQVMTSPMAESFLPFKTPGFLWRTDDASQDSCPVPWQLRRRLHRSLGSPQEIRRPG